MYMLQNNNLKLLEHFFFLNSILSILAHLVNLTLKLNLNLKILHKMSILFHSLNLIWTVTVMKYMEYSVSRMLNRKLRDQNFL